MSGPGLYYYGHEEEELVLSALRSRQMSRYRFDAREQAPSKTYLFERDMENYLGVKHCLGMNSCTSALYCALRALEIGPGDEVLVPGYTFIATIAAIVYVGAIPVLCEIDRSLTLDPEDVKKRITARSRAILAVHMLGAPCKMTALAEIAEEFGLHLIEDVAQACGGSHGRRQLGSIGTASVFSLNVFKTMTAGDGGVLATSDSMLFERAFAIHDHGARPFRLGVASSDALFGLNLRMHELTGAVALAQLRKLPHILDDVRRRKKTFLEYIGNVPHAVRREINDPEGECGTLIVWQFDRTDLAAAVASALGTCPLVASGKHYYGNMTQLRNPAAWPRPDVVHCIVDKYGKGVLPYTDDILSRSIALSVGVSDSYLGAGFGINPESSDQQIMRAAEQFHHCVKTAIQRGDT